MALLKGRLLAGALFAGALYASDQGVEPPIIIDATEVESAQDNHSKAQVAHAKRVYADSVVKPATIVADKTTTTTPVELKPSNTAELKQFNHTAITINERGQIKSIDLTQPTQALSEIKTMLSELSSQAKHQQDQVIIQKKQNLHAAILALIELV